MKIINLYLAFMSILGFIFLVKEVPVEWIILTGVAGIFLLVVMITFNEINKGYIYSYVIVSDITTIALFIYCLKNNVLEYGLFAIILMLGRVGLLIPIIDKNSYSFFYKLTSISILLTIMMMYQNIKVYMFLLTTLLSIELIIMVIVRLLVPMTTYGLESTSIVKIEEKDFIR